MFQDHLKKLVVDVDGALAAVLMGFDGISVDSYARPPELLDIQTVGMEFSFSIAQMRKSAETAAAGAIEDLTIRSSKFILIARVLTPDYFVALALTTAGNVGQGRYFLRMIAPEILAEL